MSDALERATRAVLRAIRNKDAPPGDGGVYIWAFHDGHGAYEAGVFNAERFAIHDPERCARWMMGTDQEQPCLNPPHPSHREAIKLLPQRLQKRIKSYEKQRKDNESAESGNPEAGASV